ncbi:MAG: NUDIX domain-containing protein [Parvibaculaceae bacterium]
MDQRLTLTKRTTDDIEIDERTILGKGWGTLERFHLRHRLYNGSWSETIERDLYTIGEVGAVLIYDPKLDAVLLTEQFRTCGLRYGEATWLVEIIAGIIEGSASPEETARREAIEEAATEISGLVPITTTYSSPGGYGERIYVFAATADLSRGGGIHGRDDEHEDIRTFVVPLDEALAACDDGRIVDSKTLIAVNWLVRHKQDFA